MAPNPTTPARAAAARSSSGAAPRTSTRSSRRSTSSSRASTRPPLRTMEAADQRPPRQAAGLGVLRPLPRTAKGKIEEAEEALQKAFDAATRTSRWATSSAGIFRQNEGEVIGALLLFRKAAEAYDPEAHDQLAHVYEMIARNETDAQPPGRGPGGAGAGASTSSPATRSCASSSRRMFGDDVPAAASAPARSTPSARPPSRSPPTPPPASSSDARKAFEELTAAGAGRPGRRGSTSAWSGRGSASSRRPSRRCTSRSSWRPTTPRRRRPRRWSRCCGAGRGWRTTPTTSSTACFMPIRDPQAVFELLQAVGPASGRSSAPQADPERAVLQLPGRRGTAVRCWTTGTTMARVVANLTIASGVMRLWHPTRRSVEKVGRRDPRPAATWRSASRSRDRARRSSATSSWRRWRTRCRRRTSPQAEEKLRDHAAQLLRERLGAPAAEGRSAGRPRSTRSAASCCASGCSAWSSSWRTA